MQEGTAFGDFYESVDREAHTFEGLFSDNGKFGMVSGPKTATRAPFPFRLGIAR